MNYNNPYMSPYMQQAPTQNSFVSVQNEQEARAYPVAPGKSATFQDESLPGIFYTKTMGSQFDRPVFEKYRMVKEETTIEPETPEVKGPDPSVYVLKEDLKPILNQITDIRKDLSWLKDRLRKTKEVTDE